MNIANKPYYSDSMVTLFCGDSREIVPQLGDITACVTDPPYALKFMGKVWDDGQVAHSPEFWQIVRKACLPGAPLLAFGGTRTFHRQMCAIEDAGWELRDTLAWLYGSGFPKSLDIGKALDKAAGAEREVLGQVVRGDVERAKSSGVTMAAADANRNNKAIFGYGVENITAPATDAAKLWDGYGTALKPAYEPITLAMNPLDGTFAANALAHGVAGLNVDGCRIGTDGGTKRSHQSGFQHNGIEGQVHATRGYRTGHEVIDLDNGRFPANVIHDGSDEVTRLFPETTSGTFNGHRNEPKTKNAFGKFDLQDERAHQGNSGSAARFFYTAKASSSERGKGNNHPTVKPLDLMKYLVKLVSMPERNLILDPFAGSGTTLYAAKELGVKCIGIEMSEAYCEIIAERLRQEVIWSQIEAGK